MPDPRPKTAPGATAGDSTPTPDTSNQPTQPTQPGLVDHIPRQFGRYRILDRIGQGGMGSVFKAHDEQLDRVVALKVPFLGNDGEEARQRFFREARSAATLHHPNVCPVYDVGEFRGMPFLTMAFVEGKGLDRVVKDTTVTPAQAAILVRKVALAMQVAHDKGVVHRDLKPSNVMIRPDGEPVIMDFGLARRQGDKASEGLTRRGDVLGTVEYMSPEQLDGDLGEVGPPADVYALGVLMYEVLAGRRPFAGTATQVMVAIMLKPPPPPSEVRPGVPPRLDEICMKAMAREQGERYPSMTALAADLAEFLRSARSGATPAASGVTGEPPARPSAATRPVEVTVVAKGSGRARPDFEVVGPDADGPVSTPSGGSKKRKSAKRRKEAEKKPANVPLIAGGIIGAAVLVAVLVIVFRPSKPAPAPAVASGDPPPAVPANDPPRTGGALVPQGGKGNATAPKINVPPGTEPKINVPGAPATKTERGAPPRVRDEETALAVGDRKDVAVPLDRGGYRGPFTIELAGSAELRVAPRGPITVKAGEAPPTLTVMLMGEPAGGVAQLAITATPTEPAGATPVTGTVTIRTTPSPCVRVLDVGEPVGAMAFTPDASVALVGVDRPVAKGEKLDKADHAIRVLDLVGGKTLPPLAGHTGPVLGLLMSAEGKYALSVGGDETVALWDLANGRRVLASPRQPLRVIAAGLSPDAKRAVVAYPGMVMRIDMEKFQSVGQPIKTGPLTGLDSPEAVLALAVSADRKALAGGIDGKLFLLEATDKGKPKPLTGLKEAVRVAAFSAEVGVAATGSGGVLRVGKLQPGAENLVTLWDTASASPRWTAASHAAPVVCVAFSSDGSLVASGDEGGEVRVWAAADGKALGAFKGHAGRVAALAFAPDGKTVLSGSTDRTVRTWRLP